MSDAATDDKNPRPDPAEENAFFPSPYSLSQFTSARSDLADADYPDAYTGGRWKILVIAADERYLLTDNGTMFSTGNHPVETLLPMYHMDKAGFGFDIATLSGNPVKFEHWAMPSEDKEITGLYDRFSDRFRSPQKLSDIVANGLGPESDYIGVFIPGGHGALIGLPESKDVAAALTWADENDKFVITLCHGPAALLAVGDSGLYQDRRIVAFPDALDAQTPDIGYMPGHLTWKFGEKLKGIGFDVVNYDDEISGATHQDGKLLTGDSPLAGNALGKLAASELLRETGKA